VNIPSSIITMLAGIALTLVSLWYGQNHGLLPTAASEEAPLVDGLFNTMMTVATGLFLLVQGVLIYSAIRFRRAKNDTTDGPPVHGNIPLEILWTAIPAIVVLGIAVYSFEVYNQMGGLNPLDHSSMAHAHNTKQVASKPSKSFMPGAAIAATLDAPPESIVEGETRNQEMSEAARQDPATNAVREDIPQLKDAPQMGTTSPRIGPTPENQGLPPELVINVSGLQYAWIFTYPDTGVVSSELHVPTGREVLLNISANDVLHAFWVPEFRLKQDAVPGRQTELRFTPSKVGEYSVICAELCGPYHGAMKTKAVVETPEDYNTWLESQVANADGFEKTVAMSDPATRSVDEFLSPFLSDIPVTPEMLHPLHSESTHHSM
jgi:cytochrome c oxidase subunit II